MAEIDLEQVKKESLEKKILQLKHIKNQIIAFAEVKEEYYNKGVIETLMPLLAKEHASSLLFEILSIINTFFFNFPQAYDTFLCYK